MTKKHELKAQKRVSKALGVFSKAVAEVEEIEELIKQANYRKSAKKEQMASNVDLLAKLNHFNIEE